jgi:hypothetical protein
VPAALSAASRPRVRNHQARVRARCKLASAVKCQIEGNVS